MNVGEGRIAERASHEYAVRDRDPVPGGVGYQGFVRLQGEYTKLRKGDVEPFHPAIPRFKVAAKSQQRRRPSYDIRRALPTIRNIPVNGENSRCVWSGRNADGVLVDRIAVEDPSAFSQD